MSDLLRNGRQRSVFDTFDVFSRDFENIFQDFDRPTNSAQMSHSNLPVCDIFETEKDYLFEFDIPGMKEADLNIEVIGNQVLVSGERRREPEEKDVKLHRRERRYGAFQRVFTLADEIDSERIEASYEGGVLSLRIPKFEAAKPKKIRIGDPKGDAFRTIEDEASEKAS